MKVTSWIVLAIVGWTVAFTAASSGQALPPKSPNTKAIIKAENPPQPLKVDPPAPPASKFVLPTDPKQYRAKLEWGLTSGGTTSPVSLDVLSTAGPTRSREYVEQTAANNKTLVHDFTITIAGISGNEVLINIDGAFLTNDTSYERTHEVMYSTAVQLGTPKMLRGLVKGVSGSTRETTFKVTLADAD